MKIPFTLDAWLNDKNQKVETRDGRIVHNIWRVKEPFYTNNRKAEVCALIDGEEDALVFFEGGRYLPTTEDTDNPFDLFIITPEPELSEWEKEVRHFSDACARRPSYVPSDGDIRNWASELLELAKKELCESGEVTDWYAKGKAEALKDLPRWKKADGNCFVGPSLMYDKLGFYESSTTKPGCLFISIEDLKKLPGFKED